MPPVHSAGNADASGRRAVEDASVTVEVRARTDLLAEQNPSGYTPPSMVRALYPTRRTTRAQRGNEDDLARTTAAERIAMVWPITLAVSCERTSVENDFPCDDASTTRRNGRHDRGARRRRP